MSSPPSSRRSRPTAPSRPTRARTRWSTASSSAPTSFRWADPAASPRPGRGAGGSSPLAGLVVAGGLPGDDVDTVVGVDEGDERHQRGELVIVVVLGRVRPGLVGDATGAVGDAGALLGEFQRSPFGLGED